MHPLHRLPKLSALVTVLSVLGCASGPGPYRPKDPLWRDPDRRPFEGKPAEYFSPLVWDGADQTFFRPVAHFFAVDPGGEAENVNSVDEVPDSSWFSNRIGRYPMTPADVARGPCRPPATDPVYPWTVTGAKPNGANPGFMIKDGKGDRYLIKFDGVVQGPRATAADAVVSKIYYAAGFHTPCNQVVVVDRGRMTIDPKAKGENESGDEEPLTERHLDEVFSKAMRFPDGRYRASSSLFIPGKPIGPFTYQGTRSDDPNDVVDHEDRRELRGSRLLAAWTNHFDAREQNTLAAWIETGEGTGFVEHYMIDFGDCFGSLWEPPLLGRRIGVSHYFDFEHVLEDFISFGIVRRPWDRAHFGPSGPVFGYYGSEDFVPENWKPGYPNPAFSRMTERDAAWMARIIARFTDEHVRALVKVGKLADPLLEQELFRALTGRRDKILRRFLSRVSSLTDPRIEGSELCLEDVAVTAGVRRAGSYGAKVYAGLEDGEPSALAASRTASSTVCFGLGPLSGRERGDAYFVVEIDDAGINAGPARIHLHRGRAGTFRVIGLERPEPRAARG